MGKIDQLVIGAIKPEAIYGPFAADLEHRELTELYANKADPRARKAADVTISMLMRFFDPESEHATSSLHVQRPVVFAHPSNRFEDGNQLITFNKIAKLMFEGRGIDPSENNTFMMPYRELILPVCHNASEGRMIIGQRIHNIGRPKQVIPGIDRTIDYLQPRHDVPMVNEVVIPKILGFMTVLAHADKHGLNGDYYDIALQNQSEVDEALQALNSLPFEEIRIDENN